MNTNEYIDAYADILASVNDKDVALTILVEVAKDRRTAKINERASTEPATTNQLHFLRELGAEIRPGLSKAEASKLITRARRR